MTLSLDENEQLQVDPLTDEWSVDANSAGAGPDSTIRELLATLKTRRLGFSLWVAFCIAAAIAYCIVAKPLFVATTQVVLEPREPTETTDPAASSTAPTLDSSQADSQVMILQSERNLRYTFDTLDLANDPEYSPSGFDPIGWIQAHVPFLAPTPATPEEREFRAKEIAYLTFVSRVTVKRIAQSYAFELSFRAGNAKKAASYANSITAAYIRDQIIYNVAAAAAQRGGDFLQNRISDAKVEVDNATTAVRTGVIRDVTFGHADARIVSAAIEPLTKTYPMTTLIVGLVAVFGLVSGIGANMLSDGLSRKIGTAARLIRLAGIRPIAVFPRLPNKRFSAGKVGLREVLDAPESTFAQAIRELREAVLVTPSGAGHAAVGTMPCRNGRERSVVAANLAYAIAGSGQAVTLLDVHVRHTSSMQKLAPTAERGFHEFAMSGGADARGLRQAVTDNLFVIYALGTSSRYNPNCFLGSHETLEAVRGLALDQHLIVDLPALSVSADALALGRALSGVIVVATRSDTVDDLVTDVRTLRAGGVRVLGVLLYEASVEDGCRSYDHACGSGQSQSERARSLTR